MTIIDEFKKIESIFKSENSKMYKTNGYCIEAKLFAKVLEKIFSECMVEYEHCSDYSVLSNDKLIKYVEHSDENFTIIKRINCKNRIFKNRSHILQKYNKLQSNRCYLTNNSSNITHVELDNYYNKEIQVRKYRVPVERVYKKYVIGSHTFEVVYHVNKNDFELFRYDTGLNRPHNGKSMLSYNLFSEYLNFLIVEIERFNKSDSQKTNIAYIRRILENENK